MDLYIDRSENITPPIIREPIGSPLVFLVRLFQIYRGCQIYWWRKPEYPEKTTDLSEVTDKLYHIIPNSLV
jgi:hypothetical protein